MISIRRDLVKAASRAKGVLGVSTGLVEEFLKSQINSGGGFKGRSSESDLYYTMFGVEGIHAVCPDYSLDSTARYLKQFDEKLDSMGLVDLACYIRCMADITGGVFSKDVLAKALPDSGRDLYGEVVRAIDRFSSVDGAYNVELSAKNGTAYGCFLALGAFQDAGLDVPLDEYFFNCLKSLKTDSGGYSNEYGMTTGSVPATAAAVSVLYYLGGNIGDDTIDWLLSQVSPEGGFFAMENVPVADLLSTATGLFVLSLAGADISDLRERCLDFVDSLWDGKGGFCGNSFDKVSDCEYTFYGLLALGVLS